MGALARTRRGRGHHLHPRPGVQRFPIGDQPLDFYEAVVYATRDTLPLVRELKPDVVVHDILTLGPSLAAELLESRAPHSSPTSFPRPGQAFRSTRSALACHAPPLAAPFGRRSPARPSRSRERAPGAQPHARASRPASIGISTWRHQPRAGARGHLSPARVSTSLACPCPCRRSADVGAAGRGGPAPARRRPARARRALYLSGPRSPPTSRCLARSRRCPCAHARDLQPASPVPPAAVPDNTTIVDWVSYSRTIPHCDAIVCHAGHGTLVRALPSGSGRRPPRRRRHERECRASCLGRRGSTCARASSLRGRSPCGRADAW